MPRAGPGGWNLLTNLLPLTWRPADRPPSPVNVTVTHLRANSATVSWDVPEGNIVIGYSISQQVGTTLLLPLTVSLGLRIFLPHPQLPASRGRLCELECPGSSCPSHRIPSAGVFKRRGAEGLGLWPGSGVRLPFSLSLLVFLKRQNGPGQRVIREVNTTTRACALWGLAEDSDYTVQVRSIGLRGESPPRAPGALPNSQGF